jgi:hypothetical protein
MAIRFIQDLRAKTSRPHDANMSVMVPAHIDPGQTRFGGRIGRDGPIVTDRL